MTNRTATTNAPFHAIVLAAGEGTRMRSARPKVLHQVAGRAMLGHVMAALGEAGAAEVTVVVGPDREDVAAEARRYGGDVGIVVQRERRGTAHAVLAARERIEAAGRDVLVAFADTPLVQSRTLSDLAGLLGGDVAVGVLGFEAANPFGYGRLLHEGTDLIAIREEKDATREERLVRLSNAGLMALAGPTALAILDMIDNDNAKGEFYLTDAVAVARSLGLRAAVAIADEEEVMGVNDRAQLAAAEAVAQRRLRLGAMISGATLIAPDTVFLSVDTELGRDVVVEPNVVFGPEVIVEEGATIHAFSHLEGAHVGAGASIGPFARLRKGTNIGPGAKIGNFVETKNATLGAGAKASHLTYLGDAAVGAGANIGAGTITCNYDGFAKSRTEIGEGAFIGSNSALVAPVTIGAGAFVSAGSTITKDVPADALAIGRARQSLREGWAPTFRAKAKAAKDKAGKAKAAKDKAAGTGDKSDKI